MIWVGPKCNHECSYQREEEGDLTQKRKSHVTMGKTAVMWAQAKRCQRPPEAGNNEEQILP